MKVIFMAIGILSLSISAAQATITMAIPANWPWTDTGLSLNNGDIVQISASGSWTWETGISPYSGPDGTSGTAGCYDTFLSSANHGALIAYIGVDPYQGNWGKGSFFPQSSGYLDIGSSAQFISSQNGELWLGFNDAAVTAGIYDNAGSVTAQISVTPESATLLLLGVGSLTLRKYRK
jgi:hypothetical protein